MSATPKKKQQGEFLKNIMAGAGFIIPIAATAMLFIAVIQKVDILVIGSLVNGEIVGGLPNIINPGFYVPFLYDFPGIGIISLVTTLFFAGRLIRTWLGAKITNGIAYLLESVPFVGKAYGMIKKLVTKLTNNENQDIERKPVNVEYTRDDVYVPAFSLGTCTMFKCPRTGDALTVVYVPTSPNPTSGFVLFIHPSLVHDVEYTTNDQMEVVFGCGMSQTQVPTVMRQQGTDVEVLPTGELVSVHGLIHVLDKDGEPVPANLYTPEEDNSKYLKEGPASDFEPKVTVEQPKVDGDFTNKKMQ